MLARSEFVPFEPIEKASIDELRKLQLRRLKEAVSNAYERVPHYRRKFDVAGVHPRSLLPCDSPEGRLICDEIVAAADMDAAIERVVAGLTSSGAVSAIGNRRAFRVGQEPLDLFRRYCSIYAREQAYCHFSPALIANLERNWDAQNRKI